MTVATKSSRTLHIDGMSGEDCCKKVTGALKNVTNVETHQVKVGSARIEADKAGCDAACKAIGTAGFKAHEGEAKDHKPDANKTGANMPDSNKPGTSKPDMNKPGAKSPAKAH